MRNMSKRAKTVFALTLTAVVAAGATTAALAAVEGGQARAPHSQASALISSDGKRYQSRGIASVSKGGTGIYCVSFTDNRINIDNITPQTTPIAGVPWGTDAYPSYAATPQCGDDPKVLTVTTGTNGQYADRGFYLLVP